MAQYIPILSGFDIRTRSNLDRRLLLTKEEMRTEKFADDGTTIPLPRAEVFFCLCKDSEADGSHNFYIYQYNVGEQSSTGWFKPISFTLEAGQNGQILIYNETQHKWLPSNFYNQDVFEYTTDGLVLKNYFEGDTSQINIWVRTAGQTTWEPKTFFDEHDLIYSEAGLQIKGSREAETDQFLCKLNDTTLGWASIPASILTKTLESKCELGGIKSGDIFDLGTALEDILNKLLIPCVITIKPGEGGTGEAYTITAPWNGRVVLPEFSSAEHPFVPPANQVFDCWVCNGNEYQPGEVLPTGDKNLEVVAKYGDTVKITFTYILSSGGQSKVIYAAKDKNFILPDNEYFVAPMDYIFFGWMNEKDNTTLMPGDTILASENIELKAKWRRETVTITLDKNGGTGNNYTTTISTVQYSLPMSLFTPPTGKSFQAWIIGNKTTGAEQQPGDKVAIDCANTTPSITIYAKWG